MTLRTPSFLLALLACVAFAAAPRAQVVSLPISFEDDIDYELVGFGGNTSQLIADPTDATNTVVETVREIGAQLWAGTTVADATGFTAPLPFADGATTMSVRVWTPVAGMPVRLKVEKVGDPTISVETQVNSTQSGVWETLVFDFADEAPGTAAINYANTYNKASIFFDFGTEDSPAPVTFYWDDVAFGGSTDGGGIALPVTFEEAIDYELQDFEGTTTTVVADPTDGTNKVAQTIRGAGAATFAGTVVANINGLASPIPFAADATTMSLRVWSPTASTPVRLKIEQIGGSAFSETEVLTTMAGAWETLVFDFASPVSTSPPVDPATAYDKVVVFFNFGLADSPADETYYWDDLSFGGETSGGGGIALPVTFEDDINYELVGFGGNTSQLIADPTDATNTVVETVRETGAQLWAGTTVADATGFTAPLPFVDGATTMSVRVWTPVAGTPVRLKVEEVGVPTNSVETEVNSTQSGVWETLVFDFADEAPGTAAINFASTYNKASIFFDFGTEGSTAPVTFYWDDIVFGGSTGGGGIALPVTFEEELDYELRDFEGTTTTLVADPADGANTVAQTIRGAGAATFAGTVLADINGLASPIPFAADATTMSLLVWSPTANTPVRLKVEKVGGGPTAETEVLTTMAGAWETLVFDFASPVAGTPAVDPANTYDKVVVFFNFGFADSPADETYFWDDLEFGGDVIEPPDPVVALPVTFEEDIDYELTDFGGTASQLIADPTDATNTVVESVRQAGAECYAGTTVAEVTGFTARVPFTADATTMSVRVWSPEAGIRVLFKVEEVGVPEINVETLATTTVAGGWETLLFDFGNPMPNMNPISIGANYNKASIFFDFSCDLSPAPPAPPARTYYWDDVQFGPGSVSTEDAPVGFAVSPSVYPNPTRGDATIAFDLAASSEVTVEVFDTLGRRVATAFQGALAAGPATIAVPTDGLAAGVSLVRVQTEAGVATTTFTVVR